MRILIIEDNPAIAANLYDYFEARGHSVEAARDGVRGFHLATNQRFDAILLDLCLPKMDGIVLCRKLREEAHADTPILVLTARDTLRDKLASFECGADDYLVKPFALEEVAARLGALHKRRTGKVVSRMIEAGDLIYDPGKMSVSFSGADVKLPPKCMRLLELLIGEPGRVFSRMEIEIELWGDAQETSDRVRYHMHLLRQALVRAGGRDPIKTIHGRGFCLLTQE